MGSTGVLCQAGCTTLLKFLSHFGLVIIFNLHVFPYVNETLNTVIDCKHLKKVKTLFLKVKTLFLKYKHFLHTLHCCAIFQ